MVLAAGSNCMNVTFAAVERLRGWHSQLETSIGFWIAIAR